MKSSIFWDITPRHLLKINGRFGERYPYLQGRIIGQVRNQHEYVTCFMLVCCLAYSLILTMETCSTETSVHFKKLHGVITQKTELSNPETLPFEPPCSEIADFER
jgi:hypothetical protein